MTFPATVENVLSLYLYGTADKPEHFADRLRDLPPEATYPVTVDAVAYMESVGRYAYAARATVIQDFFEGRISSSMGVTDATGRTTLSIADYLSQSNNDVSVLSFVVSQYGTDTAGADFKERAFIWGTTQFSIDPSATFVWENGQLSIENLVVAPFDNVGADENFDFEAGSEYAQMVNDNFFQPYIDPYEIGRKIDIEFVNRDQLPTNISYSSTDFYSDKLRINQTSSTIDLLALPAQAALLLADILSSEVVEYFFEDKLIVYGSYLGDVITPASAIYPLSTGDLSGYGLAIATGSGNDQIIGSANDDLIYSGLGDDIVDGGDGSDTLHGGAGADYLDGGAGRDTISFEGATEGAVLIRSNNLLLGLGSSTSDAYGDTLTGFEVVVGSDFDDQLELLNAGMEAYGGAGADIIRGGNGDDFIDGGDGANILIGGAGSDQMVGGSDADFIRADGKDTAQQSWMPTVFGGEGHDAIVIEGSPSQAEFTAQGGVGNDYVVVGANISLDYRFNTGDGHDHIVLEDGANLGMLRVDSSQSEWSVEFYVDSVEYGGPVSESGYDWYGATGSLVLMHDGNSDSITISNFTIGIQTEHNFTDFDHITMDDVWGYMVNISGEFGSMLHSTMQGERRPWHPSWETSGGEFELFSGSVENAYATALDDFNAARSGSPSIPSELWLT
ncbi:calcium-binding protein [Sphingomonas sp. UNC305MFCol5.2]|uniref:calcium-binding protein n=1 Tax=Sphingomonas sp. UNC305MFCol5.2 TaxID=1449076 RepID=UPI0004258D8A|nr:calcium-binding protein [Sphingomonas sp. UNC305MFCol5.2]